MCRFSDDEQLSGCNVINATTLEEMQDVWMFFFLSLHQVYTIRIIVREAVNVFKKYSVRFDDPYLHFTSIFREFAKSNETLTANKKCVTLGLIFFSYLP